MTRNESIFLAGSIIRANTIVLKLPSKHLKHHSIPALHADLVNTSSEPPTVDIRYTWPT